MWTKILLTYALIGLASTLTPTVRESFGDLRRQGEGRWKDLAWRVVVVAAAVLAWPLLLEEWLSSSARKRRRSRKEMNEFFEAMALTIQGGCATDEIPGAKGEFGYDVRNPVPTCMILGSMSYLSRLQPVDGTEVTYLRRGSTQSPVTVMPVDEYVLSHLDGRELAVLYLSPYQKRTSSKAPRGFRLSSTSPVGKPSWLGGPKVIDAGDQSSR